MKASYSLYGVVCNPAGRGNREQLENSARMHAVRGCQCWADAEGLRVPQQLSGRLASSIRMRKEKSTGQRTRVSGPQFATQSLGVISVFNDQIVLIMAWETL